MYLQVSCTSMQKFTFTVALFTLFVTTSVAEKLTLCNYPGTDTTCSGTANSCTVADDGVCYSESDCSASNLCAGKATTDPSNSSQVIQESFSTLASCQADSAAVFSLTLPKETCFFVNLGAGGQYNYHVQLQRSSAWLSGIDVFVSLVTPLVVAVAMVC